MIKKALAAVLPAFLFANAASSYRDLERLLRQFLRPGRSGGHIARMLNLNNQPAFNHYANKQERNAAKARRRALRA